MRKNRLWLRELFLGLALYSLKVSLSVLHASRRRAPTTRPRPRDRACAATLQAEEETGDALGMRGWFLPRILTRRTFEGRNTACSTRPDNENNRQFEMVSRETQLRNETP